MSFGFSPNDIIGLITLTCRTYKGWRDACSDYADITGTLDCLYLLLKRLETHVPIQSKSSADAGFAQKEALRRDLAKVIRGVNRTVDELDRLLDQFPSLSRSRSKNWDRIRFGAKDLSSLRARLTQHVSSISAFLNVVELESIGRLDQDVQAMPDLISERVTIALGNFIDAREGDSKSARGDTVLTTYSNDDADVWRQFRSECVKSGVRSDELKKFEPQLRRYIQSIIDGTSSSHAADSHPRDADHNANDQRESNATDKQRPSSDSVESSNDKSLHEAPVPRMSDENRSVSFTEARSSESLSSERPRTSADAVPVISANDITARGDESKARAKQDSLARTKHKAEESASIDQTEISQQKKKRAKQPTPDSSQRPYGSSNTSNSAANVVRRKANFQARDIALTATEHTASAELADPEDMEATATESSMVTRSKAGGDRGKTKGRVEPAAPPLGAGVGGAALTGVYERNKMTRRGSIEQESQRAQDPFRRHRSSMLRSSDRPSGEDLLKKFHSLQEMKVVLDRSTPDSFRNDSLSRRSSSTLSRKGSSAFSRRASSNTVNDSRSTTPVQKENNVRNKSLDDTASTVTVKSQRPSDIDRDASSRGDIVIPPMPNPPDSPPDLDRAQMSERAWCEYAGAFGDYIKAFTAYEAILLRRFEFSNNRARKHCLAGKRMDQDWLERMCDAKGMSVACVGWLTYAGRVEKDEEVRDVWRRAWERHSEAVRTFMSVSRSVMASGRDSDIPPAPP